MRDVGFSALEFAEEGEKKQGREKQAFIVETFSRLLELITLRHRLIESASETSQLAQWVSFDNLIIEGSVSKVVIKLDKRNKLLITAKDGNKGTPISLDALIVPYPTVISTM